MINLSLIAERIKTARIKSGLSRYEAARKSGVSIGTLRRYELPGSKVDLETLNKICSAYGVSAQYLVTSEEGDSEYLATVIKRLGPNTCKIIYAVCEAMGWRGNDRES